MSVVRSAIVYFGAVFGVGFILGVFRVLVLVPVTGERYAEIIELPLMIVVTILVAKWVISKMAEPRTAVRGLFVGLLGFTVIVVAELAVLMLIRQQTLSEYLSSSDPVSGVAYFASLVLFALMPAIIVRISGRKRN